MSFTPFTEKIRLTGLHYLVWASILIISFFSMLQEGTYAIDTVKHTITFNIDRATIANSDQTSKVRPFTLKGDILSWRVAARPDGSIPVSVFKRIQ
jgi:hypothetical protein